MLNKKLGLIGFTESSTGIVTSLVKLGCLHAVFDPSKLQGELLKQKIDTLRIQYPRNKPPPLFCTTLKEIWNSGLEGVVICMAPGWHKDLLASANKRQLPSLCLNPLWPGAIPQVLESHEKLHVSYPILYHPDVSTYFSRLHQRINIETTYPFPTIKWREKNGILWDRGLELLALVVYMQNLKHIRRAPTIANAECSADHLSVDFRFPNLLVRIACTWKEGTPTLVLGDNHALADIDLHTQEITRVFRGEGLSSIAFVRQVTDLALQIEQITGFKKPERKTSTPKEKPVPKPTVSYSLMFKMKTATESSIENVLLQALGRRKARKEMLKVLEAYKLQSPHKQIEVIGLVESQFLSLARCFDEPI